METTEIKKLNRADAIKLARTLNLPNTEGYNLPELKEALVGRQEWVDENTLDTPESVEGFKPGDRIRVADELEEQGLCLGEEGVATIEVVGAPQHGNQRVSFGVLLDGTDCPVEVSPHDVESVEKT